MNFTNFILKALLTAIVCVFASLPAFAQTVIENLIARSDGRAITVEWRTSKETDVAMYEIERSPVNQLDFKKIGSVPARNTPQSYRFVDETALATYTAGGASVQSGAVYVYRLKIIDTSDKITYSNTISVTHTISSVRRTWGMIKEMFR
jgi:hypothetical protein